jgi:hypothetical protein
VTNTGRIGSRFSAVECVVGEGRLPRAVLNFGPVSNFIVAERDGGIAGELSGGESVHRIVRERAVDTAGIEYGHLATRCIVSERCQPSQWIGLFNNAARGIVQVFVPLLEPEKLNFKT